MKDYKYIIIGGGMTGASAVMGIRKNDPDGSIAMFTKEQFEPYNRPPLSKGLWDNKDIDSIMRPLDQYAVDLYLETTVSQINPDQKRVSTIAGENYQYEKLLLATGGKPIRLSGAPEDIIYYRTRADFHRLQDLVQIKDHFCIIGGGFIGSELAAALIKNNKKVTLIFPEDGISGTIFPENLANFLVSYYQDKGVNVLSQHLVQSVTKQDDQFTVQYQNIVDKQGFEAQFDGVISGIGIKPNTDLAEMSGMTVENGIVVNEFLQTDFPDVSAAGDVANFMHMPLGKRVRVEHEDNANTMGMVAGENMSGDMKKYDHFPYFYSDLFDLGYEAVGDINPKLETFQDWIEPFTEGTVYYLQGDKVRGVIFWNLWGKVEEGRELIKSNRSFNKAHLQGLFA